MNNKWIVATLAVLVMLLCPVAMQGVDAEEVPAADVLDSVTYDGGVLALAGTSSYADGTPVHIELLDREGKLVAVGLAEVQSGKYSVKIEVGNVAIDSYKLKCTFTPLGSAPSVIVTDAELGGSLLKYTFSGSVLTVSGTSSTKDNTPVHIEVFGSDGSIVAVGLARVVSGDYSQNLNLGYVPVGTYRISCTFTPLGEHGYAVSSEAEIGGYTVVYDTNGGSESNSVVYLDSGSAVDLTVKAGDREGYTFGGWALSNDAAVPLTSLAVSGDTVLYAVWQADQPEPPAEVKVTGVSISPASVTMKVGEKSGLAVSVAPADATNKNVTWTSSDPSVVSVGSDGSLKALKAGNSVITVKTADGGFTATSSIKVEDVVEPPHPVAVLGVSLNTSSVDLTIGGSFTLKATVMPSNATNKAVVWTSDDPSVATVDLGVVKAVGEGQTTIKVKTVDGGYTQTATVTVKSENPAQPVSVTGVSLDRNTAKMEVGDTMTLRVTVSPSDATNKAVVWSTSDRSVVSVGSDGTLRAIGEGKATVTVKTADGGFTASAEITVEKASVVPEPPKDVKVTGVRISVTSASLKVGETMVLEAVVSPSDAADKSVVWSTDDGAVVSVDPDGKVTAMSEGKAKVTAKTTDGGFTASAEISVVGADVPLVKPSVDVSGNDVNASVSEDEVFEALESVDPEKESLEIVVQPEKAVDDPKVTVTLPASGMDAVKEAGVDIKVSTPVADFIISSEAVTSLTEGRGDLSLQVSQAGASDLTDDQKKATEGAIVFSISLKVGDSPVTGKLGGMIEVSIPYKLKGGSADYLVVYCVSDSGELEKFDCTYDGQKVSFATPHLSVWSIAEETPEPVPEDDGDESGSTSAAVYAIAAVVIVLAAVMLFVFLRKKA